MNEKISILPFQPAYQNGINEMMASIALEFSEPLFTEKSTKITDVYLLPTNNYWVATDNGKIVGTIGIVKLSNHNCILKSMFIDKAYRGQGISNMLLETLLSWAKENNCTRVYLGTMTQFTTGQRFYEKNKFVRCDKTELPTDFALNTLDSLFYSRELK